MPPVRPLNAGSGRPMSRLSAIWAAWRVPEPKMNAYCR